MRILIACEESQAVTIEMRRLGHEAYSCDIQDCSGGHPEWHIKGDVLEETNNVYDYMMTLPIKERTRIWQMGSGHSKERSKTFPGIARAMAEQWAGRAKEAECET